MWKKTFFIILIIASLGISFLPVVNSNGPPIVQITYPNDGEEVSGVITIKWTIISSSSIKNIGVYYCMDGSSHWETLASNLDKNTLEYEWDTNSVEDNYYKIQVSIMSGNGQNAHDTTDSFLINNYPQPPNKPSRLIGPTQLKVGERFNFSTSAIDLDNDPLYFWFDWGKGVASGWVGPFNSGEVIKHGYTWNLAGNHSIKVKAVDDPEGDGHGTPDNSNDGVESEWSDELAITVPRNKILLKSLICKVIYRLHLLKMFYLFI